MITFSNRFEEILDALYDNINNLSKFMIIDFSVAERVFVYHITLVKMSNDFKQRLKHVYFNDLY